jgi:hypothetical protein
MKTMRFIIPALLFPVILLVSCEPFEKVSDVPEIHFKSYSRYLVDTLDLTIESGELVFSFRDGDADFGVDTIEYPEDTINLYIIPFQKVDQTYDSIDMDIYGRKYAIYSNERLDRTGQNKTIQGEIKVRIYYFLIPPYDTIRYDFYIMDRAGNKSNVESTSDIGF